MAHPPRAEQDRDGTISGSRGPGWRPGIVVTSRNAVLTAVALGLAVCLDAAPDRWIEIQSAHFTVRSDASETEAVRVARQLELFRAVLRQLWPWARVDPDVPIVVYAARNEESLRTLLPQLWEYDGRARAGGVFLSRGDRSYVVLRTDVRVPRAGEGSPFHVLHHEYTHLVLDLNFESLPLWLHEGLAEYLGTTLIDDDRIELGLPILGHLLLLREVRLMPTADLLQVPRESAEYEGERASLFYAQSWALAHFLMQAGSGDGGRVGEYLKLLSDGVDDAEAASRALGDPRELHRSLEGYVRGRIRRRLLSVGIEPADEPTAARFLSPTEELTARGELLLAARREADARALFERALAADPHSAVAKEALRRLDGTPRLYPRTGPDDADAVLEARCEGGAHMDCVELGQRFREGTGRAPDLTKAASLFLEACAAGEPEGCAQEGWAFEFGKGVVRDLARAAAAYERACDTGREWGCVRLGLLHEQGQGVSRDPARALALYTQACDDGFAPGCTRVGVVHLTRGTEDEMEEAASWLVRACEGSDAEACGVLAALHETGQGVPLDPARATELQQKACDGGFAPSCAQVAGP